MLNLKKKKRSDKVTLVYKPFSNENKINIAVASKQSLLALIKIMKENNSFDTRKGKLFLIDSNHEEEVIIYE